MKCDHRRVTHRRPTGVVGASATRPPSDLPRENVAAGRTWVQLAQNRFWLLVPILVLDLALVGRLPPPLAPGSPGPDVAGWLAVSESVLRGLVFGLPLLMPLTLRAPARPSLVVYLGGLTAYVAAWVAVVWAPTSAWSTSAVGFTALAWTSIFLFMGISLRSTLRFCPGYRPWMYLATAALFTVVHTLLIATIWNWYY